MVVWWGTSVEVRSALERLDREGLMVDRGLEEARKRLGALRQSWEEILPSERLRSLAEGLTEKYPLRALDAFQLAAALAWCNERPRHRPFICLDARLSRAAEQAGFDVPG